MLVGVEAAAWLRAWAGTSMEAREGLLDNSEKKVARSCFKNSIKHGSQRWKRVLIGTNSCAYL